MRFSMTILGALASAATAALSFEALVGRQIEAYCDCHPHCSCPTGSTCYCVEDSPCFAPCCVDEGGPGCGCPTNSEGGCYVSETPRWEAYFQVVDG